MRRLRAAVFAPDPISHAGLVAFLMEEPVIRVTAADRLAEADVAIVMTSVVHQHALYLLTHITRQSTARIVLVTGMLGESTVAVVAAARVVRVLERAALTRAELVETVIEARETGDLLRELDLRERIARLRRQGVVAPGDTAPGSGLSHREVEVLRLVAEGIATAEIADRLDLSVRTVKQVIQEVTCRLRLANRVHVVAHAVRSGAI